jgi:hypothetical protein
MQPAMILSSHLPAAGAPLIERLVVALADVPDAPPFVGPDQAMFEQMLRQMTAAQAQLGLRSRSALSAA